MGSLFNNIFRRKNIKYMIAVVILIILGILYLWYANNYGNKKQISIAPHVPVSYSWQSKAAEYNITTDYIWNRTKSVMLSSELSRDGFIPSFYMIQGQLTEEEALCSDEYLLIDQALLLDVYVRNNDRISAMTLKDKIVREYYLEDSGLYLSDIGDNDKEISVYDNMVWLQSYINYYTFFGSKHDYEEITKLVNSLFDEDGNIIFTQLTYATLLSNDVQFEDGEVVDDATTPENTSTIVNSFSGVELRAIKLKLIKDLENNGFIPNGSFDRALNIVKNGLISSEIGLYAYGYTIDSNGDIIYIYEGNISGSVDVSYSIETLLNLTEVNEGNASAYSLIKRLILNSNRIGKYYQLVTGEYNGYVSLNTYLYCMKMAIINDDEPFFNTLCSIVGGNVATYNSSPILSMVFRNSGYRYIAYAEDNLLLYLLLT